MSSRKPLPKRRLALLVLVALGLAPGTWVRSPASLPVEMGRVLRITRLPEPPRDIGPVRFLAAWRLESPSDHFGGYSALVSLGESRLLAASDRGRLLLLSGLESARASAALGYIGAPVPEKADADVESLTIDPQTARIWAGYEGSNQIARLEPGLAQSSIATPGAIAGWGGNNGPEAMVRLADGRFLVLAERGSDWFGDTSPAVLFPGDPLDPVRPLRFRFVRPSGYSPTDMVQLPDGKVMILLRAVDWPFPPRFSAKLAVADPAGIELGGEWRAQVVADLAPLPMDNFEGLAIEPQADGSAILWLISDDNTASGQRTLLLKLHWRGADTKKARGSTARPIESP